MKKLYTVSHSLTLRLLFAFLLVASSCNDYLEVEPYDYVEDDNTIFDRPSSEAALRGAYRGLASLNYSSGFQNTILQLGKDAESVNVSLTDLTVRNYQLRSDIPLLQTYWSNNYNTINRTNHILEKVPLVDDARLTESIRNQILGEAYFIRALSYFDLARMYGNVPIFLTPTVLASDKVGTAKSTQAQVYDQVLDDLNKAESLLPETVVRNKATKYTVYALRARLNLYRKLYAEAEADVNKVLAKSDYKLIKPFALASNTSESVLELSYSSNNLNPGFSLWRGNNRQLATSDALHSLLNNATVGGGRKILSTTANKTGNIFPTNTSANYVIRTAELYLIRAEARALKWSPDITGALADLNEVRRRSDVPEISAPITTDALLLAIENERRVEFGLEPHRWFDLVRTGRAAAVLGLSDPNRYIFPIPANEILTNPALKQNDGYGGQ